MILFAINKDENTPNPGAISEDAYFNIPVQRATTRPPINENNIQLISWNQVIFPNGTQITNVQQLFDTVCLVAQHDDICNDMAARFMHLYNTRINIIPEFSNYIRNYLRQHESDIPVFQTIYEYWPHPMIGNIIESPRTRPITHINGYFFSPNHWDSFPLRYMSFATKKAIETLYDGIKKFPPDDTPSPQGLVCLKKTGRDQCRICKDWTELARAVFGEISSYISKLLEKIYALELCKSQTFQDDQCKLLAALVEKGDYKRKDQPYFYCLENLFRSYKSDAIQATGYIYEYFESQLSRLGNVNAQWIFFALFINSIDPNNNFIKLKNSIYPYGLPRNEADIINSVINQSVEIPPTIRSAMVFDAISQLTCIKSNKAWSIRNTELTPPHDYFRTCSQIPINPTDSGFLPSIRLRYSTTDRIILSSWMRNENEESTITYRHFLMPLWAGPSFRANSIFKAFFQLFGGYNELFSVVLPSIFAFWRLYYDKRRSSVATLAETFDAIFSTGDYEFTNLCIKDFNEIFIYFEINEGRSSTFFSYKDVWKIKALPDGPNISALRNSVGIIYRLYKALYNTEKEVGYNIKTLKSKIDELEIDIVEKYFLVKWVRDIVYLYPTHEGTLNPLMKFFNIHNASLCGILPHEIHFQRQLSLSDPSDRINVLFDKIKDLSTIQLNDKIPIEPPLNPPQCLTDNGIIDFIGGMEFNLVKDDKGKIIAPELKDGEIIFKATVATTSSDTSPSCWSRINKIVPDLKNPETINCTISEKDNSLFFHGEIALNKKTTLGGISLSLKQLVLESGLDSDWMNVCIKASIKKEQKSEDDAFNITLYLPLYQGTIDIYGEYDNGNVVTLSKLFELFGLGTPPKILPGEEKDFGNLGLKRLHLSLAVDAEDKISISDLQFIISTSKPWPVLKGKDKALISITPIFEIDIKDPFKKESRSIYCSATGRWTVSNKDQTETNFDVTLTSELTLYAGLAQGSELQFETIKELFGITTAFPSKLTFTDLSLMADFKSNNYSFSVAASDVYEFKVKNTTLAIKNVSCSLDLVNASFDELKLSGMFQLGKMDLNVCGSYRGEGNFDFMAEAFNDINTADENCLESANYTLGNFIDDIKDTFSWKESKDSFCSSEYLTASIRNLYVAYNSEGHSFAAKIDIENVIKFNDSFSIDDIKLQISASDKSSAPSSNDTEFQFKLVAYVSIFEKTLNLEFNYDSDKKEYAIKGTAENLDFKVVKILELFGINTDAIPDFIRNFTVESIDAEFGISAENKNANEDNKKSIGLTFVTNAGTLIIKAEFGKEKSWEITYEAESKAEIKILELDFIGDFIKNIVPEANENKEAYCIKNFKITFSSKDGIILHCKAFDTDCDIPVYQPKQEPKQKLLVQSDKNSGISFKGTAVWKQINKTIFILTIPKIGLGLDGNYVAVLLDASLKISPLTISLNEAGIGISLCNPIGVKFYLSGFGVSFKNDVLSIGGNFSIKESKDKTEYLGSLMIGFKDIGLTAIGKYTKKKDELTDKETASLCVCFSLLAPIGGIPAFFVKGIAGGFGYNERLILPPIEKVADYFLVQAAMGGFKGDPLADLDQHVVEENNQYFLTAGLKFSSFEIVNGSLLLTASFGNDLELGLLGMADISVPPNVATSPIAYAQLALKVAVRPSEGVFSAEAQLTNESYILSKKCKLTGGFAAYVWFGENEHSGDFVISLGGYHPSFNRPEHYPRVPRLGLNWQVDEHISIIGEIYFALTPSNLMAGGKLSATYTQGDLKAWFIAYADILMKWKPIAYDITVGASVGASYTIKLIWRKTVSIELSANLHLWGPEVNGTVEVTWYIISFTISFSEGSANNNKTLSWEEFIDSFIAPKPKTYTIEAVQNEIQVDSKDVISISLEGIVGKTSDKTKNLSNDVNTKDIDIVSPYQIGIKVISKIPTNEKEEKPHVRPMGGCDLASTINVQICKKDNQNESDITDKFNKREDILQNLPAALWGANTSDELNGNSLVNNLCVGKKLSINENSLADKEFPKGERWIDLAKLRQDNIIPFENSFDLSNELILDLSEYTREEFKKDENDETLNISKNRDKIISEFLQEQGINICIHIDITDFVDKAESQLSEDFMTINEQGEA